MNFEKLKKILKKKTKAGTSKLTIFLLKKYKRNILIIKIRNAFLSPVNKTTVNKKMINILEIIC